MEERMNGAVPTELQNQMMEQVELMVNPVTFQNPELRQQARLDAVGGNPNKLPKGYVILFAFRDSKGVDTSEWITVTNREELRQTVIDVIKGGEDTNNHVDVFRSYVLPEGWTIAFDEEWATLYDVMKNIEPFFDDPMYEPFDIEDYV